MRLCGGGGGGCGILQAQSYITVSGYILHETAVCTIIEAELLNPYPANVENMVSS
jgi:hypothetical protein